MQKIIKLLSIAGSDPSGGAGIQADLKTFAAMGGYGMAVLAALTAQNTREVTAIHEIPPEFVSAQIEAIFADIAVDAIKIGMLHNQKIVCAVAAQLEKHKDVPVVLDPVMVAKGGHRLLCDDAIEAIRKTLLPLAILVTPNIPEACVLTEMNIASESDCATAAEKIHALGAQAVVIKGGHSENAQSSDDYLSIRQKDGPPETTWVRAPRTATANTHGTGCTFSSAIAACLGHGMGLRDSVETAKKYLTGAIEAAKDQKIGEGHGPVDHFYNGIKRRSDRPS